MSTATSSCVTLTILVCGVKFWCAPPTPLPPGNSAGNGNSHEHERHDVDCGVDTLSAPWYFATLRPGDYFYLSPYWWHQVRTDVIQIGMLTTFVSRAGCHPVLVC